MPTDRAGDLRAALATSTRLATEVDAVLGRYEAGLGRVLKTVRPTVERTQVGGGEREAEARGEAARAARSRPPPRPCPRSCFHGPLPMFYLAPRPSAPPAPKSGPPWRTRS
jgi:hypothetical protein